MLLVLCTAYVLKSVVYHWNWLMVPTECTLTRKGIREYNKYCRINGNTFHCRSNVSFFKMSLSPVWLDNRIRLSSAYLEEKRTLRKCDFWKKKEKKKSIVSIFKNISSGNILDPGRTFRETQEWEMFALLAKGVWNPDLDSFSFWIDLNVCPVLWEGAFCQAGGSPSDFWKAFSLTLQHSSNIFYATAKIFFFRTGNQFPSQLHF